MKYSLSFLATLVVSGNAFSAVDYSYCQRQFNTIVMANEPCKVEGIFTICQSGDGVKSKNSSYYPFEFTADGKIIPHPSMNYKKDGDKEIISYPDKNRKYETVVTRNEKGEISGIETSYKMKNNGFGGGFGANVSGKEQAAKNLNSFERKSETNVKLEIKNGKCIPSRVDTINSLGDESRQDVNFDAKLCRNIAQFFKKNPEAASCFDKKLMESAQGIMNDFYKDNKDIYGDVEPTNFSVPRPQKTRLKSDATASYSYPGTGAMGSMGIGLGMGMPGATTEQMLTPMMPTIDSILGASRGVMPTPGGFGGPSPVVTAMEILTLCQGGGYNVSALHDVVYDESVWATEPQANSKSDAANIIQK